MVTNSSLKNIVRIGRVSTTYPAEMAVKVVFEDKDSMVSAKLPLIACGSSLNKAYWLPDVGEQVCCLMLQNGHDGVCIGSYYSERYPPSIADQGKRRLDFGDGSFVEFDRSTGNLIINCTGDIVINGKTISLN